MATVPPKDIQHMYIQCTLDNCFNLRAFCQKDTQRYFHSGSFSVFTVQLHREQLHLHTANEQYAMLGPYYPLYTHTHIRFHFVRSIHIFPHLTGSRRSFCSEPKYMRNEAEILHYNLTQMLFTFGQSKAFTFNGNGLLFFAFPVPVSCAIILNNE